jgi:V-type H+-transporting ATPase subunit E
MQDVILQGFLAVMEREVTVYCRKQDEAVAQEAGEKAVAAFKELSGKDISFQVDASLSDDLYVQPFICDECWRSANAVE